MNRIQTVLMSLSDVDGVIGSFVVGDSGALVGSSLPTVFDEAVLAEAGPRIVRLLEASAAIAGGLHTCVLRFAEHKLFIRRIEGATLGVVLSATASVPALKVATNIMGRRLVGVLAQALSDPPDPPAPVTPSLPPPPPVSSSAPPSKGKASFYRGIPVR